jgi:hypothetical protein
MPYAIRRKAAIGLIKEIPLQFLRMAYGLKLMAIEVDYEKDVLWKTIR